MEIKVCKICGKEFECNHAGNRYVRKVAEKLGNQEQVLSVTTKRRHPRKNKKFVQCVVRWLQRKVKPNIVRHLVHTRQHLQSRQRKEEKHKMSEAKPFVGLVKMLVADVRGQEVSHQLKGGKQFRPS